MKRIGFATFWYGVLLSLTGLVAILPVVLAEGLQNLLRDLHRNWDSGLPRLFYGQLVVTGATVMALGYALNAGRCPLVLRLGLGILGTYTLMWTAMMLWEDTNWMMIYESPTTQRGAYVYLERLVYSSQSAAWMRPFQRCVAVLVGLSGVAIGGVAFAVLRKRHFEEETAV